MILDVEGLANLKLGESTRASPLFKGVVGEEDENTLVTFGQTKGIYKIYSLTFFGVLVAKFQTHCKGEDTFVEWF